MAQASAQQFLEIREIKDGVIILKNGSLRAVLSVSSLNFALKSEEEQKAIIYQFQNFLNSLDFSIQILVQSRILNITGYLDKIEKKGDEQKNELLKIQTYEYKKFVSELVGGRKILSKTFFVVIPFSLTGLPSSEMDEDEFQRAKSQLQQRAEFISLGLRRCGHQCSLLDTLGLIEFFWSLYHPEQSETGYYPEIPPEIVK
jgi:type IV secretory pathway VirB4 component